jgi:hypothetical protein
MDLTRALVDRAAREYRESEPFAAVEDEHAEMLPEAFRDGDYGWRTVEWVVQWYYRRHLGAYPDRARRTAEAAFGENDYETVTETLAAVAATVDGTAGRADASTDAASGVDTGRRDAVASEFDVGSLVRRLTALEGVDVPVASGFLHFLAPDRFVVLGEREWRGLQAAGELEDAYPDDATVDAYRDYDETCRRLMADLEVDAWTLARALWRLGGDETP